ncbi:MAG TPA: POTRA domain-containing protein [Acidobacteriaceae bacterium]|nr:POTRA domain-containing protein [Acidobacteriaceae bacterium]
MRKRPRFVPVLAICGSLMLSVTSSPIAGAQSAPAPIPLAPEDTPQGSLLEWAGLDVVSITFAGVHEDLLKPLPGQLAQQAGVPLDPVKIRASLRSLYATGLYQTIEVAGVRAGNKVSIIFSGVPRLFVGRVNVEGVKDERLDAVLDSATQLQAGTTYSDNKMALAEPAIKATLENNGYYRGQIATTKVIDHENSLVDVNFEVTTGDPARIGEVELTGDSGLTEAQFRKQGKLKANSKVNRNTVSRALGNLRKHYNKRERLAATVSLTSKEYVPPTNRLDYTFLAHQGPLVQVQVAGAKISHAQLEKLVPVYEEGTVDQDLLNEGAQNLRNYFEGHGYFDVKVSHQPVHTDTQHVTALYTIELGKRHVVDTVTVTGNKYFSTLLITQRLSVRPNSLLDRYGAFSQQLVSQDVASIKGLYMSNGFNAVKVTPKFTDSDTAAGKTSKISHFKIDYVIDEGAQSRISKYDIEGATPEQLNDFRPFLNTQVGQPYSAVNINRDRDLVQTYYFSKGYDNAQVSLFQQTEPDHPDAVDFTMKIVPGKQFFVRKVVVSGVERTKPSVVQERITLQPGDPLNQTALLQMQRKLYDMALFNEVNTAIQNPNGDESYKNILLNLTEAKRWDVSYGFGFEVQTGAPVEGCLSPAEQALLGITNSYECNPNGHTGASPRILFNVSRTNLRGTDQSITLRTNYGTLEQIAMLSYQDPHFRDKPSLNLTLSGGYNNSAVISTYRAAILSGALRLTQRVTKPTTLIYSFSYRRVSVNSDTLQVSLSQIPLLAQPVRVGGPGITFIRDTRDVALDAHHGSFNTGEIFLADGKFGSQANFDRIDLSNSTYYDLGRNHWVFARQTRYGQERSFGDGDAQLIPLPERLYAGGATSLRGFPINSAGPRDPQTGYPVGGYAVFVNTLELRAPPPTLRWVGTDLSFVLFYDMGNAFQKSSQVWPSALRTKQPHSYTCRNVTTPYTTYNTPDTCDFNNFSHDVGLGLRYHTPIGPIRGDISYNLNPPIYPVIYDYTTAATAPNPHVGQAGHFNFFFSIGQSF